MIQEERIKKVLIDQSRLQERVLSLGREISEAHAGHQVTLISILKGSFIFAADLLRAITIPVTIDFMAINSYATEPATGVVRITKDLEESIAGRHAVLVEDIIDTGLTANYLLRILRQRNPASLELCALLDKSVRRLIDLPITYRGFDIPDLFVVGYGMDYQQHFRNLPYIGVLRLGDGQSSSK